MEFQALMEMLLDPAILAGLATLVVLEVVLGIDNLVFIAVLAEKLPPHQRDKARLIGLSLALVMRLGLLASIAWIMGLKDPVFHIWSKGFSWRDIILVGGGIFLLVKATKEIHERLEGHGEHGGANGIHAAFWVVIAQILALDAVFSIDSIITAVGMVDELWVMVTAVIIAMGIMILASKPLTDFVGRHPTVIILCLSFLLLIGCSLVAEGFGVHFPKGYLYAAIGFSILIELFNQLSGRNRRKALAGQPLRQRAADGIYRLLTPNVAQGADDEMTIPVSASEQPFKPAEQAMIRGVIELADLPVRSIMTPRSEIFWLDVDADLQTNRNRLIESARTRVLLGRGSLDDMIGMAETRLLLARMLQDEQSNIADLAQRPLVVPDNVTALRLIDVLRDTGERFAVVVDGDGNIDGVVSTTDIFAAIAGDIAEDEDESGVEQVSPGVFEADAKVTLQELASALGRDTIPEGSGRHTSLAGYLLFEFGRVPSEGEVISLGDLNFTIIRSQASRIGRVRIEVQDAV